MYIEKLKFYMDLYECRSFTETAKKNFISQASLSQYIGGLEKEFQVKLFDRSVTPIEPTKAGTLFFEEAKILLMQYDNMRGKMANFQKDQMLPLKLAYTSMVDIQTLFSTIPDFKEEYPQADLQLNKILIRDVTEYLERRVCDVAISFASEFEGHEEIQTQVLYEGRYAALVGSHHPLFQNKSITLEELYQYPLIMLSQSSIGNAYDVMINRTREDGYVPDIQKTVDDIETELFSIMTDNLIGFAPDNDRIADFTDNIRLIPIESSKHVFSIDIGYLKKNENPTLKLLLETLKKEV